MQLAKQKLLPLGWDRTRKNGPNSGPEVIHDKETEEEAVMSLSDFSTKR